MASESSEDAESPNKLILSTEEDDKPKKPVVCCRHGVLCRKGMEEAARAKALEKMKAEEPKKDDTVDVRRMKKTLRSIRKGIEVMEIQKDSDSSSKKARKSKKGKERNMKSSRKESRRKRKEKKSKKGNNSDTSSTAASEASQSFSNLEKFANVTPRKKMLPSKRLYLGVMGREEAEKALIGKGKRVGLYFKMEKINTIDDLELTLPGIVVFSPYGSNDFKHYVIVQRCINGESAFVVEGGGTAEVFRTLDQVACHYEKISDGRNLNA